jgi:uncharacterized membrane protein YwzB
MSSGRMIELVAAVMFIVAAVWLYRRNRAVDRGYGSQGAVLLLVVGAIMAIHALGALDYRPSASELDQLKSQGQ